MSQTSALASYADVREALDRALESPRGVRIACTSAGAATHLRQRIYSFRKADRKRSCDLYPSGDPRHNVSVYDELTCQQVEGDVLIMRPQPLKVEDL